MTKENENIPFNSPYTTGQELQSIETAFNHKKFSGDGPLTKECHQIIETSTLAKKALLTTSCTDALELSALALGLERGDEVIMPSYTFVSTANAFALRGALIKFVDIDPLTMNIDPAEIEKAISPRTKAIVVVHYAGVACDMDRIQNIAKQNGVPIIEDAAQAVEAYFKGKHLGSLGAFGTFSFHETKNIQCGEGGAILINDSEYVLKCEIAREKGTNRSQFLRGQVDKYSWQSLGSSFLPNELTSAFLIPQLKKAKEITQKRLKLWNIYHDKLHKLAEAGFIKLPYIPAYATHNAHMYYIKTKDITEREELTKFLKKEKIQAVFHYIPLHSSIAGKELGEFVGEDCYTTIESERLLRLPLFCDLEESQVEFICEKIIQFYQG